MAIQLTTLNTDVHQVEEFDCGETRINNFFRNAASKSKKNNILHTFVLTDDCDPSRVMGFYSITNCTDTPPAGANSFLRSRRTIPGVLVAQMGVDSEFQGQKLGAQLLVSVETHYLVRMVNVSPSIGLFVDAMTADLVPFYGKYGYSLVEPNDPKCLRLWKKNADCQTVLPLLPTLDSDP